MPRRRKLWSGQRSRFAVFCRHKGNALVEVCVATLVASMFATATLQLYVQTLGVGAASQDQIMVAAIAEEAIDSLRGQAFSLISNSTALGTHNVPVVGASPTGDSLFPRPLLEDTYYFKYSQGNGTTTEAGGKNVLNVVGNTVTVTLSSLSSTSVQVEVSLTYQDRTGEHTYQTSTIIASNGLNG